MLNKIGIFGSNGRMNTVLRTLAEKKNLEVENVTLSSVIEAQILIDFSVPEMTRSHFELAEELKKPILICTTGHTNLDFLAGAGVPTCYAPNTCIEWLLIKKCILQIAALNKEDSYITIEDIHSSFKRDIPSGTALNLYDSLFKLVSPEKLNLNSVRKLEVPSWHKCSIYCENHTASFAHQVLNREVYAVGALRLAELLLSEKPGLYTPEELLQH